MIDINVGHTAEAMPNLRNALVPRTCDFRSQDLVGPEHVTDAITNGFTIHSLIITFSCRFAWTYRRLKSLKLCVLES